VIAASESLRHIIHMMDLIDEFKARGFPVFANTHQVHTRLYEDNSGAIEIMKVPKVCSRTKHLNVKNHHYREAVRKPRIKIFNIESECQPSDMLTKSLSPPLFLKHQNYDGMVRAYEIASRGSEGNIFLWLLGLKPQLYSLICQTQTRTTTRVNSSTVGVRALELTIKSIAQSLQFCVTPLDNNIDYY